MRLIVRRKLSCGLSVVLFALLALSPVAALGQTTGSINGTVTDDTGGVLPGVTVTVTGPALMGAQTAVTNERGQYRFPMLAPGVYRLTYELQAFATVVREGIQVNITFTATVDVAMRVASLEETLTVTGAAPVVDVTNTNIQNTFTAQMMKDIPNQRDVWGLLAVSPGVAVSRFDVGGSTAGTQTNYSAYGTSGQVRIQLDGVNTTEGTGGSAFYYDYGSFEEVQIGTGGNDASMPTPGVFLNAVVKSGGNELKGDAYFDFEHEKLQGRNVDDRLRRVGVGEGSRITKYFDPNFNLGGPIKFDKLWYFVAGRYQRIGTTVTGFPVESPGYFDFVTRMEYATYKLTYQPNINNRVSQYFHLRRKLQPFRGAGASAYTDSVYKQESFSGVGNLEWNRIVNQTFFTSVRLSKWGYNWGNYRYGIDGKVGENVRPRMTDLASGNAAGGAQDNRTKRGRWQLDWSGQLFRDNLISDENHNLRFGYLAEWEDHKYVGDGYFEALQLQFNSPAGAADFSTPFRVTIQNTPRTAYNDLFHQGAYVQDQISIGDRLTLNAGVRWDMYSTSYPEQDVRAAPFRDFFYAGVPLPNGYSIPASYPDFKAPGRAGIVEYLAAFGPRVGLAWKVRGDSKTVAKANWGRFYFNPGVQDGSNPMTAMSYTFAWTDRNGDRQFSSDELGAFVSSSGGVLDTIDPNIGHPYTDDMGVWLEQEILPNFGARIGFVYKREQNLYQNIEQARLGSLYTRPVTAYDPGPDGIRGNADDRGSFTVFDIPSDVSLPASRTVRQSRDEYDQDYKTLEFTLNKRMSNRWSLLASAHMTWNHELLYGVPQNPNQELYNEYRTTDRAFKIFGTYRAPWGVAISPILRHQRGIPVRRIVQVTGLRAGTFNYTADPFGEFRQENVTIFDTRLEKRFSLVGKTGAALFFDAFNIANSNAAQDQDNITGRRTLVLGGEQIEYQRFLRPTTIIGPRVYRVGFKVEF
jgi:outer membrane receptor protein involved in Fe transport